ncbi:NIPSNAP-domain-containing protein [Massarina eburnea CBS 473.64]|uniref:NIPSNAP-domain-containing protein n=1 Tax=Massarina eburnea CBS 473.64 TaxID=1395130 RepID=A0A6A6S5M8_9PLEO|nr:NIPSNAP-domain-containing protein [Massarina eburnea CBS 473.64]
MFTRRACASVRSAVSVSAHPSPPAANSRSFAAFAAAHGPVRAPALADVKPSDAADFTKRQKEFRDGLVAAQKKKEDEEKARTREHDDQAKKGGALKSLIYGTPEGRELDQDIERSFSQVLARGKYVHSIVTHEVKPDKVDEYTELVGSWYPKMASMPENKVHLVGSWRTEVGDCDTFVHIWEYQRYEGYHSSLNNIQHHPEFPQFDSKLKKLINSKRTSLMQEFSFWPTTPPRRLGGIFELRSYTLHPGNLLEWETHWRRGLAARREVMEGVGAWFVQIGELNTVHHLWQFANLEERKVRREQSWSIEGWGETVHKTVPLIQSMQSRILIACPWSTVA